MAKIELTGRLMAAPRRSIRDFLTEAADELRGIHKTGDWKPACAATAVQVFKSRLLDQWLVAGELKWWEAGLSAIDLEDVVKQVNEATDGLDNACAACARVRLRDSLAILQDVEAALRADARESGEEQRFREFFGPC